MVIIGADELKADIKAVLFLRQFHFVIIGEGQVFKRHLQNCLLFEKVIPHDNGGSSNVQMTSLNQGRVKYRIFLQIFQLVIRAVEIFW